MKVPLRFSTTHQLLMNLRDLAPFATEHGNQLKMKTPSVTSPIQSAQIGTPNRHRCSMNEGLSQIILMAKGFLCPSSNESHLISKMNVTNLKSSEAPTVKTFWDKHSCSTTYGDDIITPVRTMCHQKIGTNGIELTSKATMNDFAKIIQKPFIELYCITRAKWKYNFWIIFECVNQSVKIYLEVMRVLGCPMTIENWAKQNNVLILSWSHRSRNEKGNSYPIISDKNLKNGLLLDRIVHQLTDRNNLEREDLPQPTQKVNPWKMNSRKIENTFLRKVHEKEILPSKVKLTSQMALGSYSLLFYLERLGGIICFSSLRFNS